MAIFLGQNEHFGQMPLSALTMAPRSGESTRIGICVFFKVPMRESLRGVTKSAKTETQKKNKRGPATAARRPKRVSTISSRGLT